MDDNTMTGSTAPAAGPVAPGMGVGSAPAMPTMTQPPAPAPSMPAAAPAMGTEPNATPAPVMEVPDEAPMGTTGSAATPTLVGMPQEDQSGSGGASGPAGTV